MLVVKAKVAYVCISIVPYALFGVKMSRACVVKILYIQVLADLNTAASVLGLGPRPLRVKVKSADDDDDDDDEEGSLKVEISETKGVTTTTEMLRLGSFCYLSVLAVSLWFVLVKKRRALAVWQKSKPTEKLDTAKEDKRVYLVSWCIYACFDFRCILLVLQSRIVECLESM